MAEFYRCLEYGLNWLNVHKDDYKISTIYSFKYMSKMLINKDTNKYICIKEEKQELKELLSSIEHITCINDTSNPRKKRKNNKTLYVKPNPIKEMLESTHRR